MRKLRELFIRKESKGPPEHSEISVISRIRKLLIREKALQRSVANLADLEHKAKFGLRITQPSLMYSAPPLSRMDGYLLTGGKPEKCDISPDTKYPIPWTPVEGWRSISEAVILKETESLYITVPIGITKTGMGFVKGHKIAGSIPVPLASMPYGFGRIGIIGRRSFTVNIISPDIDTRLAYTQRAYEIEKTLRHADETAFKDIIDLVKKKTEIEKSAFLKDYWDYLSQGRTGEPEDLVRRVLESATKKGEERKP